MKKSPILLVITLALGLSIGFFGGMQYKTYQIAKVFKEAFTNTTSQMTSEPTPEEPKTIMEEAKKEELQIIEKNIGDEVVLATLKFKVNKVEEKQTINSRYGTPKVAKEGAKFVIINMSITNLTDSKFSFSPDDGFRVVDNQKREFTTYSDSIGAIDDYLNYKGLSPSIPETGNLVYELPNDATSYSIITSKAGTKELYKVLLK